MRTHTFNVYVTQIYITHTLSIFSWVSQITYPISLKATCSALILHNRMGHCEEYHPTPIRRYNDKKSTIMMIVVVE